MVELSILRLVLQAGPVVKVVMALLLLASLYPVFMEA